MTQSVEKGGKLKKIELIEVVASKARVSKTVAEQVVDSTLDLVKETVSQGKDVRIAGFGTFFSVKLKGRNGFNPKTSQYMSLPEVRAPRFRPGEILKKKINSGSLTQDIEPVQGFEGTKNAS